ncbi:hypothetical protein BHE74_00034073 [Ensete ventricosum]|nr:hypothetical protein BHE74_00034073 [Ensete ventricosum]
MYHHAKSVKSIGRPSPADFERSQPREGERRRGRRRREAVSAEGGRKKKRRTWISSRVARSVARSPSSRDPSSAGDFFSPHEENERGDYALCIPFGTGYRTISSKARYADTDKLGNPCTMISLWCIWENTFRMFQKAISCYEKALAVSTQNFSAFAGLAYTYHLQDNFDAAITYYHKVSLRVNCDYN